MSKDKYDRQTRLWGEGQHLISLAKIICFGSDMCSTEILKNLVLSGVGQITIVDNAIVTDNDLKHNFFIYPLDKGKSRAESCLFHLLELNSDVKGNFISKPIDSFISTEESLISSSYDILISANNSENFNKQCAEIAHKHSKRFIIVNNFGLINYIKLYENYHGNMQLRLLENPVKDMRIANPFKELNDYCMEFNLSTLTEIEHKHIPYIIILIQALQQYKQKYPGQNPSTASEKKEFKEIIANMKKYPEEDNFKEAMVNYFECNKDKLNVINEKLSTIFEVLKTVQLQQLLLNSNDIMGIFFIICFSLMHFYQKYNQLPVVGNIPDMVSDTTTYINLKKIYEAKGKEDRAIITQMVNETIKELENDSKLQSKLSAIKTRLSDNEINFIDIICKNWPQISLFTYPQYDDENNGVWLSKQPDAFDEEHQMRNLGWYIIARACEKFNEKHKRYAGECGNFKEDIKELKSLVEEIIGKIKGNVTFDLIGVINEDLIFEMCRFGRGQVPACVSMIGSMASQEIIKMITYQFDTVNNTIVYDGIHVTLSTFKI